ncbi:MAG: hypothetical protein OER77_11230, partial [Myxococcales bacterium]|nr:hypothetical protein [Myxococcales bacterium]
MRSLLVPCLCLAACIKPEPVQDPLEYLRIGVDPRVEALAVMRNLENDGYRVGRRIDEPRYFAFDAARRPDSTVRIITARGPALSMQTPDVRAPHQAQVTLAPDPRPDFDHDGQRDILIAIHERDRTCLAWVQVDVEGFVSAVFRPQGEWGDAPCVIEVDPTWPRLLLEVSVPNQFVPNARVNIPVRARVRDWVIDDSPSAQGSWERELERRETALAAAASAADSITVERLRAEVAWIEHLRGPEESADAGVPETEPMLEAA